MSYYHDLARPGLAKEAGIPLRAIGRSLVNKGFWGTAAKGGEVMARRGGNFAHVGNGLTTGANVMRKASPYLAGYGMAGMVADPLGYNLPGSSLAFGLGAPGWGALMAAPQAIRSARLATGKYDDDIKEDAMTGARTAGQHWITATQQDGRNAYDPAAYKRFLQENGIDTASADRYFGKDPVGQPSAWRRLGNVFENPTGNVLPQVRQGVYDQMHKGASFGGEMEKEALLGALKGAWGLSRAAGGGHVMSGLRAGKAGWQSTAPSMFLRRNPNVGKWGGRALTTGMVGLSVVDGADAIGSDKPYDEAAVQQEGYDGGMAGIQNGMNNMTPFQRRMAQLDPSLAVNGMEQRMPGTIASWQQANGQQYQPGFMGGLQQAWNGRGTPGFYNYDDAGAPQYF